MENLTEQQQATITGIIGRMRADGWEDAAVATRSLAEEAAEFGNFTAAEVADAGEGAVAVFRDFPRGDTDRVEWEIPNRGLIVAADGRILG